MASRFPAYEDQIKRSGEGDATAADVLLGIFRDLDARIDTTEGSLGGLDTLASQLVAYGKEQIDVTVTPIRAALTESADLGAILIARSVTPIVVGTGVKTMIVNETDRLKFAPSAMLVAVANDDPTKLMWGRRLTYSKITGELMIEVLSAQGTGEISSWTISTGAMVGLAAQVPATPPLDYAGLTVQALITEIANRLGLAATEIGLRALLDSPDFEGIPRGPTPALTNVSRQFATTAFVRGLVDQVISAAPGQLDTLSELAAALGNDANFASNVLALIGGKQPASALLGAFAGVVGAANKLPYLSGATTVALADLSPFFRTLMDDASAAAVYTTLGEIPDGQLPARMRAASALIADVNALAETGFYRVASTAAGLPVAATGMVQHQQYSENTAHQVYVRGSSPQRWSRWKWSGAWTAWKLTSDELVGTVSVSGGLATGAGIERGSNANGEYTRYADGTQECWASLADMTGSATVSGGIFSNADDLTWTFPAAFSISGGPVSIDGLFLRNDRIGGVSGRVSPSATSVAFRYWTSTTLAAGATVGLRFKATGRWF